MEKLHSMMTSSNTVQDSFHSMMTMCASADDTAFGHFLERLHACKPAPDSAIDDPLVSETDRHTATDVQVGMSKWKSLPELASRPSPILRAEGKAAACAWVQRNSVSFSSHRDVRESLPISSADSDTDDAEHPYTSASSERSPWL